MQLWPKGDFPVLIAGLLSPFVPPVVSEQIIGIPIIIIYVA